MPISQDTLEKTKENYLVYQYQYKDADKHLLEKIGDLQSKLLAAYRELNHKIIVYLPKKHEILNLFSEKKNGLRIELKKTLDAGSIVEWTTNKVDEHGKLRRPKSILYVERRSELSDATGYMEEQLKWTVDIDFSQFVRLDCIRIGNKSILKLTGRDIDAAQKEFEEKRKKKK